MTKKIKMSLLGLSTVAAMAAPVALAVSCGDAQDVNGTIDFAPFATRERVANSVPTVGNGVYNAQLILDGDNHSENDHSFNESVFKAISSIPENGIVNNGVTINKNMTAAKPASPSGVQQFASVYSATDPNTIMVMPGFIQIDPLIEYLKSDDISSKNKYAILLDGDVADPRVASVNFQAHQAGFEAGVLAGYYLNENKERFGSELKVATFGGLNIPPVVGSMVGFQKGVDWFNSNNDNGPEKFQQDIEFMDNGSKADYFSGGFEPGHGKPTSDKLVSAGADLIFPVDGPQTNDVMLSIKTMKSNAQIIGVDSEQELDPVFADGDGSFIAFSAVKDLTLATTKILNVISGLETDESDGYKGIEGLGGQTIGDLENGLVRISQGAASNEIYQLATSSDVKNAALNLSEFDFIY